MADAGGSWANAGISAAQLAAQVAAMAATGVATGMKIDETIQDYEDQVTEYKAKRSADQVIATKDMVNASKENAYRGITSVQEGGMAVGSAKAGLGFSGVAGQSPLMAIAQTERLARDATAETVRAGNAGLSAMGLKYTTLTGDYNRAINYAKGKQKYLRDNRGTMIGLATVGGMVDLTQTLVNVGDRSGWFK